MLKHLDGIITTGFFRTGSTFFFSSVRQVKGLKCYYEPYHPDIVEYVWKSQEGLQTADKQFLGHTVAGDYFEEYKTVDLQEMENAFCKETRLTNHPVLGTECEFPELENYINFLIDDARVSGAIPLLQANRLNFCTDWLKKKYPDFLIVLITRDYYSIFKSLQGLAKKDGVHLDPHSETEAYWNVDEIFRNLVSYYQLSYSERFSYYQKLVFILKIIESCSAKSADIVISYEDFIFKEGVLLQDIMLSVGLRSEEAEKYVRVNGIQPSVNQRPSDIISAEADVNLLKLLSEFKSRK